MADMVPDILGVTAAKSAMVLLRLLSMTACFLPCHSSFGRGQIVEL
jgi:hypothetical protein